MAIHPLFFVLVRNYRVLETNSLVQSPNLDLTARGPQQIIIRTIDGEHMGEPRALNDAGLLGDDTDRKAYRHAAHGVCTSIESHPNNFPVWVCLQRQPCPPNHLWVLNLSNFEFLVVPITEVCWVPSHEAPNGDLYTTIGSPGKHGYEKETRLPMIVQKVGFPEQTRFDIPLSSLSGFERLQPGRQQTLFGYQSMKIQQARLARSRVTPYHAQTNRQLYRALPEDLPLPNFYQHDSSSDESEDINPEPREEQVPEACSPTLF
ncbi:hypothetical protein SAMD00023353_4200440 [Rosellinia necatrix]|uniref:Uncharacterized protein n=1 Tax=Rosellinia necatrix TaxID=77044 RepID=A0A1W2TP82_ROSNE|nr:hypothetical protein SAMD00023353_4200440 [Rosellinia necatrix]